MLRRLGVATVLAGVLALPAAGSFAAPLNAPTAQVIQLQCTDGGTYTIVTNSGNSSNAAGQPTTWGPGFIVAGGAGKGLPLAFSFTGTDLSTNTVLFSSSQTKGQAQGPKGNVQQCGYTQTAIATAQDAAQAPGVISVGDLLQYSFNATVALKTQ